MHDLQSRLDTREIPIDRVGVCDLKYPIIVMDRENRQQSTTARLSLSVNLPREFKGTHMSRERNADEAGQYLAEIDVPEAEAGWSRMGDLPGHAADVRNFVEGGWGGCSYPVGADGQHG